MPILRDLVTRISFRTDESSLRAVDRVVDGIKDKLLAIGGSVMAGAMLRAGGNIDSLRKQLDNLAGDGIGRLQRAMAGLRKEGIFSNEQMLEAMVTVSQMGFETEKTARLFEQAGLLTARSNRGLAATAEELAAAMKSGADMPNLLLRWRLITQQEAMNLNVAIQDSLRSTGAVTPQVQLQIGEALNTAIERLRPQLEQERRNLEGGPSGAMLKIMSALSNVWNQLSHTLVDVFEPVIVRVAGVLEKLAIRIEQFEKWWDSNRSFWDKPLWPSPRSPDPGTGGDGSMGAGPSLSPMPGLQGPRVIQPGYVPGQRPTSFNWSGDINLNIQLQGGGNTPEELASVVEAKLRQVWRDVVADALSQVSGQPGVQG